MNNIKNKFECIVIWRLKYSYIFTFIFLIYKNCTIWFWQSLYNLTEVCLFNMHIELS